MTLTIEIKCDNAAFEDNWTWEASRILRLIMDKWARGHDSDSMRLLDVNGNHVGFATVDRD